MSPVSLLFPTMHCSPPSLRAQSKKPWRVYPFMYTTPKAHPSVLAPTGDEIARKEDVHGLAGHASRRIASSYIFSINCTNTAKASSRLIFVDLHSMPMAAWGPREATLQNVQRRGGLCFKSSVSTFMLSLLQTTHLCVRVHMYAYRTVHTENQRKNKQSLEKNPGSASCSPTPLSSAPNSNA